MQVIGIKSLPLILKETKYFNEKPCNEICYSKTPKAEIKHDYILNCCILKSVKIIHAYLKLP